MKSNIIIELKNLTIDHYRDLRESMTEAYPDIEDSEWEESQIRKLLEIFPEGQLCVLVNGKVVASALSIIIKYDRFGDDHTYDQITGNYTFNTHDPNGDVLYGIEVFVHPENRGMRLGRRLYESRKELCENLNLRSIMAGGRIPNYNEYSGKMTPKDYIDKVARREIYDPVLTFQLSNDFKVKKILRGYLEDDKNSKEFATLLEWTNIYYEKEEKYLQQQKAVIRIGLVQWQMRLYSKLEELYDQMEFFVDAVSGYKSDFILFPEFFGAPLMEQYNHLGEAEAIRKLAKYTIGLRDKFVEFAIAYNVNIIMGSMPLVQNGRLYNVGYLCRRDGSYESYTKLHITPSEYSAWGMLGGNDIRVFDTDCGKIGVLICYDVEFPELSRIMADQGMKILFVPFLTDTQNGYMRVRLCAQARAIENECYVAIAGSVGNLPRVNNMDIQFAQSGVFTPSDFAFPNNAIKAEATPNSEMTLIADVDFDLLKELHNHGSVRNLKDRRLDLYQVVKKRPWSRTPK
ncbi:MAG: GNAT family N-acetyltransferase [Cyclobacteriaceae bacterium]